MQGSLYPDGVTVDRVALRRTELTKAAEILRDRKELTSGGILTGAPVVVNTSTSPNVNIDVPAFSGFTPNGEFIEVPDDILNQPLADYTGTTVNLVCAFYTERQIHRQPHESNGQTYPVHSEASYRFKIITQTAYNLLPLTDPNLANDAQDRCLVRAKVTANGSLVSLTAASIAMPVVFGNFRYTVPAAGTIIKGVEFRSVSSDTPLGNGTLTYTYTASPLTYAFKWAAYGHTAQPTAVSVLIDGIVELTDAQGSKVWVEVSLATLPLASGVEIFNVRDLYFQDMPRFTGEDMLHRSMHGTGRYSPQNPHGMSMDDLSGENLSLLDEHQNIHHTNGIWRGSDPGMLGLSVNVSGSVDSLNVSIPTGNNLYYVDGSKFSTVNLLNVSFLTPAVESAYYYEVYVSNRGSVEYLQKLAFPYNRNCNGCWVVNLSENYPANSALRLSITAVANTSWSFSWQLGASVSLNRDTGYQVIRLYARDAERWVDLCVNTEYYSSDSDLYLPTTPGTYTDSTISVVASKTETTDSYMIIGGVSYWYNPSANRWTMGWNPPESTRVVTDLRSWGTLGPENLSSRVYDELLYTPLNEQGRSGVVKHRTKPSSSFALASQTLVNGNSVRGGVIYCRGRRVVVAGAPITLNTSNNYMVWCDSEGSISVETVTGGSSFLQAAMGKVLGGSLDREVISDIYQSWGTSQAPERGVLLWYLEVGATEITRVVDMMQNVNQVQEPWSVGASAPAGYRGSRAAYHNLFSAFAYAEYYYNLDGGCPTLKIIGPVTLNSQVTQPAGCSVVGGGGTVTVNKASGPLYMWVLGEGCTVSGVKIVGNDFTGKSSIFAPSSDVLIENCKVDFDSNGCLVYAYYLDGDPYISNVNISKNVISNGALVSSLGIAYTPDPAQSVFFKWKILNNTVTGTSTSGTSWVVGGSTAIASVIELRQHIQAEVSGNVMRVVGDAGRLYPFRVVSLFECSEIVVQGNDILLGVVAESDSEIIGFASYSSTLVNVRNNVFRRAGLTKGQVYGVLLEQSNSYLNVCSNTFHALEAAVFSRYALSSCSFSDNLCDNLYGGGMYFELAGGSSESISMCRNTFVNCTQDPPAGSVFSGMKFAMIYVEIATTYENSLQNLVVSGNIIQDISAASHVYGINLKLDTTDPDARFDNVIVSNNSIRNLVYTGTDFANAMQRGIVVYSNVGGVGDNYITLCQVNNNSVKFATRSTAASATQALGIYFRGANLSSILNNIIYINQNTGENTLATGIYVAESVKTKISGNNISCSATGIYSDGEGALISDNKIAATGTGIYVKDISSHTTVSGNDVSVYVQSDGGVVLADSVSPYGVAGASYGFIVAADRISVKGNTFKLIGSFAGNASAAVRLPLVADIDLCDNYILASVQAAAAFASVAACTIVCAPDVVTRLHISGCTFADQLVSGLMSATSVADGLLIAGSSSWAPETSAITGSITGNTFHTGNGQEPDSGVYEYFNYQAENSQLSDDGLYCIRVEGLPDGTHALAHRSLLSFSGNTIHCPVSSSKEDGDYPVKIARVYLPRYSVKFLTKQGCCLFEKQDSVSNDSFASNRVTFNGASAIGVTLLGLEPGTRWYLSS
jgi:hypothetical protein